MNWYLRMTNRNIQHANKLSKGVTGIRSPVQEARNAFRGHLQEKCTFEPSNV